MVLYASSAVSVRVSGIRTSSWVVIICSALVGELVLLGCLWLCLNERRKKKERPHGKYIVHCIHIIPMHPSLC